MVYNSEQRAYATITYELTKSYIRTARQFSTKFGKKVPSRKTVLKWDNNLHEIGSMVKPGCELARTVDGTWLNEFTVASAFT